MARPFSYPGVAALDEGQMCAVNGEPSEVKRECALYGARSGKRFLVTRGPGKVAVVLREPVTDAELPGA